MPLGMRLMVGIPMLVIGLVMAGAAVVLSWNGLSSLSWPTAIATVQESYVYDSSADGGSAEDAVYRPVVIYRYVVEDKVYQGTRIRFGDDTTNTRPPAQRVAERYPAGSTIDIYYHPNRPAHSVLEPGLRPGSIILLVAGLAVAGTSLWLPRIMVRPQSE